jgi:SAM-dependent methyltransferase
MDKSAAWYQRLDRLFDRAWVFNVYQALADGGKTRQIRRFLSDVPYASIVDIGCGTGNWASLARGRYLGVDTSAPFIEACRERYADDPDKRFVRADAATLAPTEPFDLALLISVLHHLPDDAVRRLLPWIAEHARYFFVLDLYPIPWHPIARVLYALDRGNHIRIPEAQQSLLADESRLRLVKASSYFAPSSLYRHTLFLYESTVWPDHEDGQSWHHAPEAQPPSG